MIDDKEQAKHIPFQSAGHVSEEERQELPILLVHLFFFLLGLVVAACF